MILPRMAGILILILAGCMTTPLPRNNSVRPVAADTRDIAERFRTAVPDKFYLLSSIVFEYGFYSFSGLGYLDIDTVTGDYKVMCMNQLGVKLFEFQENRKGIISRFVIEPLSRRGDIGAVVGGDIRRIYLEMVPSPEARSFERERTTIFRQRAGEGALEYEFSGQDQRLTRKTYAEDHRAVWRAFYSDYRMKNGKLFPGSIVFTNYLSGYRLIVRVKEILG